MNLYVKIKEIYWRVVLTYYLLLEYKKQGEAPTQRLADEIWTGSEEVLACIKAEEEYKSELLFDDEYHPRVLAEDWGENPNG